MSRPFRPLALGLCAATALGFAGCKTSTPYTAVYSPRKNYYVPPPVKADKAAEELLTATDVSAPGGVPGGLPADGVGLPPAGLPPPAPPAADPLAPPPAL